MNTQQTTASEKLQGYCLLAGSALMILTMVLHPAGGDIKHIVAIANMAIVSHSIAVISVPITAYGFYGLGKKLSSVNKWAMLAYSYMFIGLLAVMLAAMLNGIALPLYAQRHYQAGESDLGMVNYVLSYSFTLNNVLSYIFIGFFTIAQCIWSIIMLHDSDRRKWLGAFGLILVATAIAAVVVGVNMISVTGFTIYVFGITSWIMLSAYTWLVTKEKI